MCKTFNKSEQGTKAAWKGFSSQTTYIAHRLMLLEDELDFYPERTEDLLIKQGEVASELVQVKNLTADLTLSHLSPKDNDSFFKRCLSFRKQNENLVLRIISFGDIGVELKGLISKNPDCIVSVKTKLEDYGYEEKEIDWIMNQLTIENANEQNLLADIYAKLKDTIESMAAPNVVFDVLINYVSTLSRNGGHTSRDIWKSKLQEIAIDLAAASGMAKQYGNSILPIYEYKDSFDYEILKEEYSLGVNAIPQHIRANLDIERPHWLNEISTILKTQNIVLIRGASGQGKTSLAYRYLLNNYPERDIICVEKIISEEQAIDIRAALTGLAKNRKSQLAVYIDVMPYDTNWLWLVEQIFSQGTTNIILIITIREEDFRRSPIDYSKHKFIEVELKLSKEEANDIYQEYETSRFLSFKEAWESFGEEGPLMEFVYMLNQADTLKNRLSAQIKAIVQNESNADEWLRVLTIISYAGKNNIRIDITKLFTALSCHQQRKMLSIFEKEYFIRTLEDGKYIESLHALRATILYEILEDESLFPVKDVLIAALKSIVDNAVMLIIEYIYKYNVSDELIDAISAIHYTTWSLYASVIKALLWAEVFNYYTINKKTILEGDSIMNNTFVMFGIADATGYFKKINLNTFLDIICKDNPIIKDKFNSIINKLEPAKIEYHFIDMFIKLTIDKLPINKDISVIELTPYGFTLFWLAKRNFIITEPNLINFTEDINKNNFDEYLNFIVGLQLQGWEKQYLLIRKSLINFLFSAYNIVYLKDIEDEIHAYFIIDFFSENQEVKFNDRTMSVVETIRKLYIDKKKYNVKMIGHNIIEGIEIPDTEKSIEAENLNFVWISQLNGWLLRLHEYTYMPPTWVEVVNQINKTRKSILDAIEAIIQGIDFLYKKSNLNKLISKETKDIIKTAQINTSKNFGTPQCSLDKYGLRLYNSVVDKSSYKLSLTNKPDEAKQYKKAYDNYCNAFNYFLTQKDSLLVERIKGNEISPDSHRSLINLISALEDITEMQLLFKKEFSTYNQYINDKEEYEQLCLLSAIWTNIYNNNFYNESSLLYKSKEYIKSYRRKIAHFFDNEICNLSGVESVKKLNDVIEIIVNNDSSETFLRELFREIKSNFPDIKTLTLNNVIFKEFFKEIHILLRLNNTLLPGGLIVENRSFALYDEADTFLKRITPIMELEKSIDENPKNALIKIYANLGAFPQLLKHSTQVNTELQQLENIYINVEVYDEWLEKTSKLFASVFDAIFNDLKYIYENIHSDKIETEPMFKQFMDVKKTINENINDFVKTNNYEEVLDLINTLKSKITEFFDLYPAEDFNL